MEKEIAAGSNLIDIARTYGVAVDTVRNVNFASAMVAGVGSEPKVIASAFNANPNQATGAIVGKSGVFVLKPLSSPRTVASDAISAKRTAVSQIQGQVRTRLINEVKAKANVESNLSVIY